MKYDFKTEEKKRIIDRFGNEFLNRVRDLLNMLQSKWVMYIVNIEDVIHHLNLKEEI